MEKGLFVRLHAKAGKEAEVEQLLQSGLPLVQQEAGTRTWFALRFGKDQFGIFDSFADDPARQAHLTGRLASALMDKAGELLAEAPSIERADVMATKLPS
jgi:quinol monooxygenase YgiN